MSGNTFFVGDDAAEVRAAQAHRTPVPPMPGWTVTDADAWVERVDLGPGVATFYPAGSAIPPELSELPRHAAPLAPPPPVAAKTRRARPAKV